MVNHRRQRRFSSSVAPAFWLIVASSMLFSSLNAFTPRMQLPERLFSPTSPYAPNGGLFSSSSSSSSSSSMTESGKRRTVSCPLTLEEMIRQVTAACREASEQGLDRQIVRILLPRDASSADFGTFFEASSVSESASNRYREILLVPPDESWQGGIMQLYRAVLPTAREIVQRMSVSIAGLPNRIVEDRSVDESGVDGVGRLSTSDNTDSTAATNSIVCYVQPTQEVVNDYILSNSKRNDAASASATKKTTIILLNPQWRQVNDALDTASAGDGLFSSLANFLGGKGGTLKRLSEAGYEAIYTLEGYVCRGFNVRLLQILDSDWTVFCEKDNQESFVRVGQTNTRPTYQQVDAMLQESNIGFKYALDFGREPKL